MKHDPRYSGLARWQIGVMHMMQAAAHRGRSPGHAWVRHRDDPVYLERLNAKLATLNHNIGKLALPGATIVYTEMSPTTCSSPPLGA